MPCYSYAAKQLRTSNATVSLEPNCDWEGRVEFHVTEPQKQRGTGVPVQHFQPAGLMSINGTSFHSDSQVLNFPIVQFCLVKRRVGEFGWIEILPWT